ncbi:TATA box-binding protein-associated factor RNA polymerase I subunit B [Ochlerotatus camptorhynchus]|uniref:TATA box-binding protein-associated factor RNA polymerase I subunit B n=1 Tax=Ochlerotatus camptorhynchus TaxID=644619 RepID=UPI0031D2B5CD
MVDECEVCGQNEFAVEAGFHYCVECGTKSQRHGPEMVDEFDETAVGTQTGAAVIKIKKIKKKCKMITSWEQINYILLGYTDRLVTLGAGDEFKLTVLQLWTTYLRRMEVAFFDKEKPERPRLHVFHKSMDATILYNRRKKKPRVRNAKGVSNSAGPGSRPASEAASSTSGNTSARSTRKVRSEQRSLLNAEYDSLRVSQQSDVNRSLHELSMRSMNASLSESESEASSNKAGGQRIKFSRLARIRMKRKLKMSTDHINKHEKDLDDRMTCHNNKGNVKYTDKQKPGKKKIHPENLTRMVLVSILGLGLNTSQSDVQLADLVRFHREEHISHTNLKQYLPEELDPSCCTETIASLQRGLSLSHQELRAGVVQLIKFLNVDPITPDLQKLCKRYLDELCLPADLMIFLKRLMAVFPPKMPFDGTSHLPNYEGRAMAFIIFMLKLLFGLNDTTEMKLSKSAAKFNQTLTNLGPSYRPLFVFREWIRYLEMRKVILAQVHHPTNRLKAKEEGIEQDIDLFIDHNMRKKQGGDKFRMSVNQVNQNWMSRMKDAVTNMVDTHHRLNVTREPQQSIEFEPSLTSNRSYFETFLLAYNREGRIHVPDYMRENHSDRAIFPLVSPSDLKQLLRTDHQITLKTKKVPSALSQLELVDTAVLLDFLTNKGRREPPFQFIEDCEESEWTPPAKRTRSVQTHEQILARILIRNKAESERTQHLLNSLPSNPAPSEADETATNVTMSTIADKSSIPDSQDSFIPPYQNSTHSLLTPNYDYWIRFSQAGEISSMETFDERISTGLPNNFRLVLEECARVIENHPSVLYRELMALETYFFYAVQPVERFFDGTKHCEVQLETAWTRDPFLFRRVSSAVKDY